VVDIAEATRGAVTEQARPSLAAAVIQERCCGVVTGKGIAVNGPSVLVRSALVAKHRIGVLPPTPRGSTPTMSNRSMMALGRAGGCEAEKAKSLAESPGPPGLTKIVPRRWRGSFAWILSRASLICWPWGLF
jgi:hypothetical protein